MSQHEILVELHRIEPTAQHVGHIKSNGGYGLLLSPRPQRASRLTRLRHVNDRAVTHRTIDDKVGRVETAVTNGGGGRVENSCAIGSDLFGQLLGGTLSDIGEQLAQQLGRGAGDSLCCCGTDRWYLAGRSDGWNAGRH